MDQEENDDEGAPSRAKRYLKSARTLSGIGGRLLGEKIGLSIDHQAYAALLTQTLGTLKGPTLKIAQILATVPNMLPPDYAEALRTLQANAPAMGPLFVKRRMKAELGVNWEDYFESFSVEASFAASLGQVHQAILKDGTQVACKLQYPNMPQIVSDDLKQLAFFCGVYEKISGGIRTTNIQKEIRDHLFEELDYTQEARHMSWFARALSDEPRTCIATSFPHLSTHRLLTMSWLEGRPFLESAAQPQEVRELLGQSLFRAWYKPFYRYGILHGDPHMGNYTVRTQDGQPQLNLLDFGCVRTFPGSVVEGVIRLYQGLQSHSEEGLAEGYRLLGFENLTKEMLEVLTLWAKFLYEPLLENRVRALDNDFSGEKGKAVASKVHKLLRHKGGIEPPRTFVLLDRAAVGIGAALIHLKVKLNWHQIFEELIEGFEESLLNQNQAALIAACEISPNVPSLHRDTV
jgi:predicted unusual protein kinase regulating ubiquinone biosynthesis (AarF/ABC1/UbiB family)